MQEGCVPCPQCGYEVRVAEVVVAIANGRMQPPVMVKCEGCNGGLLIKGAERKQEMN